jgi:hypothetical protein
MKVINRTLLTLLGKPSFVEWINLLPGEPLNVSIDEVREDCNGYLIEEVESEDALLDLLEEQWPRLAEAELMDWSEDPQTWPKKRSLQWLKDHFDMEVQTVVYDLVDQDISKEDY